MKLKRELLLCECNNTEHQIVLIYDDEGEDGKYFPICYAHVHLTRLPLLKRLKYAFWYVLGRRSSFGAFEEFIFSNSDAEKVQELADYLKTEKELFYPTDKKEKMK